MNLILLPLPQRPRPADWCYRCDQPGHFEDHPCWPPARPLTRDEAVRFAYLAAFHSIGLPELLRDWHADHVDIARALAERLGTGADLATCLRTRAAREDAIR